MAILSNAWVTAWPWPIWPWGPCVSPFFKPATIPNLFLKYFIFYEHNIISYFTLYYIWFFGQNGTWKHIDGQTNIFGWMPNTPWHYCNVFTKVQDQQYHLFSNKSNMISNFAAVPGAKSTKYTTYTTLWLHFNQYIYITRLINNICIFVQNKRLWHESMKYNTKP